MNFLLKIIHSLWGDMSRDEAKKFVLLGFILMVIIGNYWMLRTNKNAIFRMFVDFRLYQPWVKIISVFAMVVWVAIYGKLVDIFKKDILFYILGIFFGVWLLGLSFFLAHPHLVSINEGSFFYPYVAWIPGRLLGWVGYLSLEALTLLNTLFWATVASTTVAESAKKGYGMIMFITQFGTVGGSLFAAKYVETIGIPGIVMFGGFLALIVPFLIKLYMNVIPQQEDIAQKKAKKKEKTSFMEGFYLLLTKPYVMGIFVVSAAYEVVGTILEYQMQNLASIIYPIHEQFAAFGAKFAIGVNTLALVFALIGTSFFMRKFGLRFCLIAFPSAIGIIVGSIFLFNAIGTVTNYNLMWALFIGMVGIKGLNYALNNPTKEVMYIPTSTDVKFKAKSWIDAFGNRTTKGIGSGVNATFSQSLAQLMFFGTIVSLGVVGAWIVIATFVGNKFTKLQKEDTIIE